MQAAKDERKRPIVCDEAYATARPHEETWARAHKCLEAMPWEEGKGQRVIANDQREALNNIG